MGCKIYRNIQKHRSLDWWI